MGTEGCRALRDENAEIFDLLAKAGCTVAGWLIDSRSSDAKSLCWEVFEDTVHGLCYLGTVSRKGAKDYEVAMPVKSGTLVAGQAGVMERHTLFEACLAVAKHYKAVHINRSK